MKEKYQVPQVEIIQVENEGIMANSIGDLTGDNPMFPSSAGRRTSSNVSTTSSVQDLEDLINDIFTVSK